MDSFTEKIATTDNAKKANFWTQQRDALMYDLEKHRYTITVNLVKNKRPPSTLVDDLDFELDAATGRIMPLGPGDLPAQYRNSRQAAFGRNRSSERSVGGTSWTEPELHYDEEPF